MLSPENWTKSPGFRLGGITRSPLDFHRSTFFLAIEWRLNNALIDEHSIALSNIESVFQGSAEKRKKLLPGTTVSSKCKTLKIHCKVVNAILHHAFPPQIKLMFAFEYQIPVRKKRDNVLRYNSSSDWRSELLKCKCESGWRISQLNESFKICDSLPEAFVVPNSPVDALLVRGAPHFTGHRLLKWCWGNKLGNSIIRMAALDPAILESKQFQYMIENVERCHPQKKTPRIFTLENLLPTYKDIHLSFQKFKQFCISENATDFWEQDAEFTTGIESSKWLQNISLCLTVSRDVASTVLSNKISVILVENDDRDMNCVISSLAQLILDPQFRTVQGFQSLIQKEWVAMGHRFSQRLGHVRDNDQEECYGTVQSLLFLRLFCLTSPKQRFDVEYYTLLKEKRLQSVWDWTVQFAPEDTNLFINPLYVVSHEIRNYVQISLADERKSQSREKFIAKSQCDRQIISRALAWSEGGLLDVKCNPQDLALWEICYFRWLPFCQILSGGAASDVLRTTEASC
ncbi:Myotubularin-related protein 10 [Nymphon striatum]|nr:Myotubularin-related protein 10 [Nymphon striatum]